MSSSSSATTATAATETGSQAKSPFFPKSFFQSIYDQQLLEEKEKEEILAPKLSSESIESLGTFDIMDLLSYSFEC